jgi:GrpB-like predicted nucleotidyltransferase (UPF0157 family)
MTVAGAPVCFLLGCRDRRPCPIRWPAACRALADSDATCACEQFRCSFDDLVVRTLGLMATVDQITRHDDSDPDDDVWVGARPTVSPIDIVDADPSWPAQYEQLVNRIRRALGDRVLALEHIGSTSVPDLPAKPIIDIDLTVTDSSDEPTYVPPLEAAGFALTIREPKWHQHRMMVATSPPANVHVWSPDSPEAIRHLMFRDWLRDHPDECRRYAKVKRAAAEASNADGETVMKYNLRKQPVVRDILDRIFQVHGML